jgi:hypothetical protein
MMKNSICGAVTLFCGLIGLAASVPAEAADASPAEHSGAPVDSHWWAYEPIERPPVPEISGDAGDRLGSLSHKWVTNPIDAFILAKLAENGLAPAPPADKVALLRRATYDLTGLPPTPEEVSAFLADDSPDAFAKVVDRLLASPHYGEKWGRHWLDLVRYAETNGYERDSDKPNVWRYRDYVIRSFNEDKPYDQFVMEQLAGDELDEVTHESIIATGYYRLGIWDDEPTDPDQAFYDSLDDVVRTTGEVFLAMTVGCARCHDHKIDPILQRDYYSLLAFFENTYRNIEQLEFKKTAFTLNTQETIATDEERQAAELQRQERDKEVEEIAKEVSAFEERILATLTKNDEDDIEIQPQRREEIIKERAADVLGDDLRAYERTKRRLQRARRQGDPPLPQALAIKENGGECPPTHVHLRGSCHALGDEVKPGFPAVLGFDPPTIPASDPSADSCGRRRALAEWLVDPANPLTARVMVNRIWQHHFGRGLVETSSDFGRAGSRPTHPELLDWLATEFVQRGWRLKTMHQLIMLSSTYRMSSAGNAEALAKDPTNQLFWRFNMRRQTAEEIRDSILSANGTLNLEMFGPSVYPPMPQAVRATSSMPRAVWGDSPPDDQVRRTIYAKVKRSLLMPMLAAHDQADTDTSCPVRFATTVPTQSLSMLNSEFMNTQAKVLAERIAEEAGDDAEDRVELAMRLATSREPTEDEIEENVAFLQGVRDNFGKSKEEALQVFCLMVLNLNEFVYLD